MRTAAVCFDGGRFSFLLGLYAGSRKRFVNWGVNYIVKRGVKGFVNEGVKRREKERGGLCGAVIRGCTS